MLKPLSYAMYLLKNHPELFLSGLNPPPSLYLVAPWSPLLPSDHPDYYSSPFAWIPGMLIETQHLTVSDFWHAAICADKTGSSRTS